jgi:hypothetical protein
MIVFHLGVPCGIFQEIIVIFSPWYPMQHLSTGHKCVLSLVSHEAFFNRSWLYFILVSHVASFRRSWLYSSLAVPCCISQRIKTVFKIFNVKRQKCLNLRFIINWNRLLAECFSTYLLLLLSKPEYRLKNGWSQNTAESIYFKDSHSILT